MQCTYREFIWICVVMYSEFKQHEMKVAQIHLHFVLPHVSVI
jgi:hypothetical protein